MPSVNPATFFFCGYHSSAVDPVYGTVVYTVEPYENVPGCAVGHVHVCRGGSSPAVDQCLFTARVYDRFKRRVCLLLAVGLALVACSQSSSSGVRSKTRPRQEGQEALEELGPAGQQELRSIVSTGKLDSMQWPNFSDHIASVKEFYEETGYKLGWSQRQANAPSSRTDSYP